jgi:hypothetical protein
MADDFEIGSRHIIWVNPFCDDTTAEVVAYDQNGDPIVRTLDKEKLTLEPDEYIFPTKHDQAALEAVERHYKDVYGEDI